MAAHLLNARRQLTQRGLHARAPLQDCVAALVELAAALAHLLPGLQRFERGHGAVEERGPHVILRRRDVARRRHRRLAVGPERRRQLQRARVRLGEALRVHAEGVRHAGHRVIDGWDEEERAQRLAAERRRRHGPGVPAARVPADVVRKRPAAKGLQLDGLEGAPPQHLRSAPCSG